MVENVELISCLDGDVLSVKLLLFIGEIPQGRPDPYFIEQRGCEIRHETATLCNAGNK